MIAVVRSEWLKLRTTAIPWVLTGIALLITGLLILVYFLNHGAAGGGGHQLPSTGFGPPHENYPHTVQQLRNLIGRGIEGYLFALLLGVLVITVEFRHKTVTTSFMVTPRRWEFVLGKLLVAALAAVALAIVLLAATVIGGGIALSALGGSFSALVGQLGAVAPGLILVFVLFALLGVGVGSLVTNQVAALDHLPGLVPDRREHHRGHLDRHGQVAAVRRRRGGGQRDGRARFGRRALQLVAGVPAHPRLRAGVRRRRLGGAGQARHHLTLRDAARPPPVRHRPVHLDT